MTDRFVIGLVRTAHGLAGKVKVASTSGESEHFAGLKEVALRKDGVERACTVESVEGCASSLVIKFGGIDTPEDAKRYAGWEIVVPRDKACPLERDEYYVEDLKQCTLVYRGRPDGEPAVLGTVTGVLEGGAGDLLEVSLTECPTVSAGVPGNEKPRTVLIPFRKEFIGDVDTENGTVELMHLWILE